MGTMINLQMVSRCLLVQLVHHGVRLQHGKYELKSLKMLQHGKCKDFSVKMHGLLKKSESHFPFVINRVFVFFGQLNTIFH